jgi:secretion/DNA translocation related TadE-like protein
VRARRRALTRRTTSAALGRGDTGAGSALVVGLVAVVAITGVALLGAGSALVRGQQLTAAADAAALAAADVLLGWAPGDPCAAAERVAAAHEVRLSACAAEGLSMIVRVETGILGLTVSRSARAGPPDGWR